MTPVLNLAFAGGAFSMRTVWLAVIATQFALANPALTQNASNNSTSAGNAISEKLPLFAKNHCETHKNPANQLFCADPELIAIGAKLASAIQDRLNRIPDRLPAVEENAQWLRDRNLSCGIFGNDPIRSGDIEPIVACLSKETEERIAILRNPNFDCLAASTAAGTLICSEPSLAEAESELNGLVRELIGKLKDDEARDAAAEYARWIRDRDRRCRLAGKDNVPLAELSSSQDCLENYLKEMTAGMLAARGDPKRVFLRILSASRPNADAVDLCVTRIHTANACGNFLRVRRVFDSDTQVTEQSALVTAEVEMVVLAPFAVCSPVASNCTGTCWDIRAGKPGPSQPGNRDSFGVTQRIRIEKSFAFQKTENGRWRCDLTALKPVVFGTAFIGQ
jgi:uncharacterized protein YecT (DUF1311 family)